MGINNNITSISFPKHVYNIVIVMSLTNELLVLYKRIKNTRNSIPTSTSYKYYDE